MNELKYGIMRKEIKAESHCIWFIAPSNPDYEEVDINEFINLPTDERYITLYVYNWLYNCIEPYSGWHIKEASKRIKEIMDKEKSS